MKRLLFGIALVVTATPAWAAGGRSCYGESCRDKIMQQTECSVTTADRGNVLLRSMPSDRAQAVGLAANGEKVAVADRKSSWAFVQATESHNGGWISAALLTGCGER